MSVSLYILWSYLLKAASSRLMSPYSTYLLQDLICNSNPIKFVIDTPPGGV